MSVRGAVLADEARLFAIVRSDETFRADEIAVAEELIAAAVRGSSDYELLVDDGDGDLLGYICFGRTPMTASTWDLYWIIVDARHRGKGAARRLIEALESYVWSHGGGQVRVETSETEAYGSARGLYAALKYPEMARFPDFYGPGDALVVYYKQLTR